MNLARGVGGGLLVVALIGFKVWVKWNRAERRSNPNPAVITVESDPEIRAASERARMKMISTLGPVWANGAPEGESLHVKSPFPTPSSGEEYMWVEVSKWSGNEIIGILVNKPVSAQGLSEGMQVTVRADQVFDYVHTKKDGTMEGNETEAMIEAKSRK